MGNIRYSCGQMTIKQRGRHPRGQTNCKLDRSETIVRTASQRPNKNDEDNDEEDNGTRKIIEWQMQGNLTCYSYTIIFYCVFL